MKSISAFAVLLISTLGLLLAGCGTSASNVPATPVYKVITQGTLKKGDTIPTPTDSAILTVTGLIGTTNADNSIVMDIPTIESLGQVDYTVKDPFEMRDITYRGVLMSQLLDLWQIPDSATTLHMVALNDYAVDVPIKDLRDYPVIFALQADGVYMPVSTHGPAMLVFPYNDFKFNEPVYNEYWIWQIKSVEVR